MGKIKCFQLCNCFSCFRAKFYPNENLQLQALPKPQEANDETDDAAAKDEVLIIRSIDSCLTENSINHHTSKFELINRQIDPQLVVRRGQNFQLVITLSRPYNEEKDGISFVFTVDDEEKPSYGHGSLVAVPLLKKTDRRLNWNVVLDTVVDNTITVQVISAPDAIVAKWRLEIDTKIINDGAYTYSWETGIFLLFNPWCKADQVYLHAEDWRDETILNDTGIIWRGTANRMRPVVWKYDQFEKNVLECALYVVSVIGKVKNASRADPVVISRAIAAATNSADDLGVVMGNWSDDHGGGNAPTNWLGSKEIMQKYYKKKKPVKYGQCWVFSGVLTTIARALGIPCRPVTNYSSAHDTQSSLTVDYFMDEEGTIMDELNSDSIWNFHVWNEVWMQRPDLGREYGGWQVIDATPQELSNDMYKIGPTSVFAIKQGEVKRPYDGGFLYAEVNADKVFWKYTGPTQPLKLLRKDVQSIGKQISTKSPGRFERDDITSSYKYPEKTKEERATMLKALRQSENLFSRYYLNEDFNDIYFNFELRDDIKIGQPFDIALVMKNKNRFETYKVKVLLRVEVTTYRGKVGDNVKKEEYNVTIKPDSTYELKLTVTYEEYNKRLVDQCAFIISCLAQVEETKFEYYAQDDFRVRKPDIKIMLQSKPVEGKECIVDLALENPLPVPYKSGEFKVEAPGIEKKLKLKLKKSVPAGGIAQTQFKFTPPRTGRYTIAAKFVSKEIEDVDGFTVIMVEPTPLELQNGNGVDVVNGATSQ